MGLTWLRSLAWPFPPKTQGLSRLNSFQLWFPFKLMSHYLACWRCGTSLAFLSLPLRRLDVCKACNAELHVCKMCVEYNINYAKHCREPTAEEVRKKDEANFCDFYKPKVGAYVAKDNSEIVRAQAALQDLFRK